MKNRMDVLELNMEMFDKADVKNAFIKNTTGSYLVFANAGETSGEEVVQIIEENALLEFNDIIVFGENVPETGDFAGTVCGFDMKIFAMMVKREVMESTGSFNEILAGGINYEFLCRVSDKFSICYIPCAAQNNCCSEEGSPETMAYVIKRYMVRLKSAGLLNDLFGKVAAWCDGKGVLGEFNDCVNDFLGESSRYIRIFKNTAPFYVIIGDETCNGVLRDFAMGIVDALAALGQAVAVSRGERGLSVDVSDISKIIWKGVVGFQAPALENPVFKQMNTGIFQFWFDNPAFFNDMFAGLGDNYYILCQDGYYAEHIRKYYGVTNAIQFPPAGKEGDYYKSHNKIYDVVFIGTYNKPDMRFVDDEFKRRFFAYMIENPEFTFEQGLKEFLKEQKITLDDKAFLRLLNSLANVCRTVINYYRQKVVEVIISKGIKLHVYGASWNCYESEYKDNLIIHEGVLPDEAMKIMSDAKISLNVMTWHKAGMTERIANSMLAGAVCLSDETVYLKENFSRDEIVLFDLRDLERVPDEIKKILENEDYRVGIVENAYKKVCDEHTWRKRAKEIIKMADKVGVE